MRGVGDNSIEGQASWGRISIEANKNTGKTEAKNQKVIIPNIPKLQVSIVATNPDSSFMLGGKKPSRLQIYLREGNQWRLTEQRSGVISLRYRCLRSSSK